MLSNFIMYFGSAKVSRLSIHLGRLNSYKVFIDFKHEISLNECRLLISTAEFCNCDTKLNMFSDMCTHLPHTAEYTTGFPLTITGANEWGLLGMNVKKFLLKGFPHFLKFHFF